jgi:YD repeat-containing protein
MNHVTQVTMPRSTGTQTRTFNYNNTAFLQSATNPENGTVTYTYTANGMPATKIDAKGQKIAYTYDGYNRLTQVQRYPAPGNVEDLCQRITYYYDSDPFAGSFSQYPWRRRTGVEYGNATSSCWSPFPTQFAERYSYTQGGLVTKKRLTVTANVDTQGFTNLKSRNLDTEQNVRQ